MLFRARIRYKIKPLLTAFPVQLRGAIQALRERKDLTASEAELLKSLQQRLRNLTELKRTGADLEQKRPTL
jgi:hypothetical protein